MSFGLLEFFAPDSVRRTLAQIGRTESVAVSPDGCRLALAAYNRNQIYVFEMVASREGERVEIRVPTCAAITSSALRQPHGCTFLDDDHLLVCNRGGDVALFHVPDTEPAGGEVRAAPLAVINGKGYVRATVKTPGSAVAYPLGDQRYRVFVCNDQWHFVTSHIVTLGGINEITNEGVRIEHSLQIPDGICLSADYRWIAISNHVRGEVHIFANTPELNRRIHPVANLKGSVCPHGLNFDSTGHLYVADAASPYVHVYEKHGVDWHDRQAPTKSLRLLDNDTFYKGRYAAREGGVKGVYVDRRANVLITTHKLGVLHFYDLPALMSQLPDVDEDQMQDLRLKRDAEVRRSKNDVLSRKWTLGWRARQQLRAVKETAIKNLQQVRPQLTRLSLARMNKHSQESIVDPAGPTVSLTSHLARVPWVHLAIESIARGSLKPARIVLWLPEKDGRSPLPETLLRLKERGLQIRYTRDLGPHTKYYPYLGTDAALEGPLVTADDDILYPRDWLRALAVAHKSDPTVIHCHRARRMRLNPWHFEPYGSWEPATDTHPHPLNFAIGAAGIIYPTAFLRALKTYGIAFLETCPTADDIWLHRVAYREGCLVAQVAPEWPHYPVIPASQITSLSRENLGKGSNQIQLASTYTATERAHLLQLASTVVHSAQPQADH